MTACRRCGAATCEHHELVARAFGLKGAALCFTCLAAGLALPREELAGTVADYVSRRDCYLADWRAIGRCALGGEGLAPSCLPPGIAPRAPDPPDPPAEWTFDETFDGGDAGCGDLLFDLRQRFSGIAPGTRVLVVARDAGAPLDLPAWCRVTGHALIGAEHPYYLLRRKE